MKPLFQLSTFLSCFLLFICCSEKDSFECYDLRCENLTDPLAIDNIRPHLSWKMKVSGNNVQHAYRILVASDSTTLSNDSGDLWDTGIVESPLSVMIPYLGAALQSPSLAYWKVKIWDNEGKESSWSPVRRFGVGILSEKDWKADYIGLLAEDSTMIHSPLLRKSFDLDEKTGPYLLHVNSLGYHEVYINGDKVGDDVLSPAVSQMDKRTLSVTYDVSSHIKKGKNELVLWLGQGWYRKGLFWGHIDEGPFVKARLDMMDIRGCRTLLATDDSWLGSESEYSGIGNWFPHRFGGERIDARKALSSLEKEALDQKEWKKITHTDIKNIRITPQMCEPNRIRKAIKPADITQ